MKNYYEILEVSNKASKEVIEKAYKVLAKKYHPDRYTGDRRNMAEERLKEINVAYKILSDDLLRDQYDNELSKEKQVTAKVNDENYNKKINVNKKTKEKNNKKEESKETYNGIIGLTQQTVRSLIDAIKNLKSIDMVALGLTILIMATIGVILWVLSFTHDWMYNMFIGIFK